MSHDIKTDEPKAKEGEGFLHRMGDRIDPSAGDAHSGSPGKSALDLGDIQGIILRGYRMPMVRHFLLSVGVPAEARKMLGRLVSGNKGRRRRSPLQKSGRWVLRQVRETIPLNLQATSLTTALIWVSPGRDSSHWKSKIESLRSPSTHSPPSPREPLNERPL